MMPGRTGMDVLAATAAIDPAIDVILLTAHYSTEAAVQAIQKLTLANHLLSPAK